MAIDFYDFGELSSGFAGWRVAGTIRGKRYQKYFSLKNPLPNVTDTVWRDYQALRARYFEAKMLARSAACQYIDFISTTHRSTLPGRGLGFQGMTLAILQSAGTEHYRCQFMVNRRAKTQRFCINDTQTLDQAWNAAMDAWETINDVRPKDAVRIRRTKKPAPEAFKVLRRQMNEHEGHNIPVDALHHVFAGQREALKRRKAEHALGAPGQPDSEAQWDSNDLGDFAAALVSEIERYRPDGRKREPA